MKNNIKLTLRISETDMALLKAHTKATRLSQSAYIRMLIRGVSPKAYPPSPFFDVLPSLHQISGKLAVIADTAQVQGEVNAEEYRNTARQLFAKILILESAVTSPELIRQG